MAEHTFSVILSNRQPLTLAQCNNLYEFGCSDGTIGFVNERNEILFTRNAQSLEKAIKYALRDIREAGFEPVLIEVCPGDIK